ncbi:Cobalamin biosynthesis protein CbiA [Candidatus Desulfarcum epimagneticum]|uniref:Cobalamin biosynthesis protein CbiA n=1 Tax=uncultured Desulfobacteraceae bacterium TaxID=218296 RepID=A0A484HL90_9BACT|nr:Cobalamin biosynthesis protein CbiA [uncultured Desulfobacteraceae bacterium]
MEINLDGIVVIVGNYGSGKTQVSIHLALMKKRQGADVRVVDLDLVNPYFRVREACDLLTSKGIGVVIPPLKYFHADLPILDPAAAGAIQDPRGGVVILDAGGDDAGSTVLASLSHVLKNRALKGKNVHTLMVVSHLRPMTRSQEACVRVMRRIEKASGLRVTGFAGNANLMEETDPGHIYEGHEFVQALSKKTGIPVAFVTAPSRLIPELDPGRFSCPLMPLDTQASFPWKKRAS